MQEANVLNYIKAVLENIPNNWIGLTTHRLDIYTEKLAKTEFLEAFENLYKANNSDASALSELPTAYDYIRLGHPLSCVLEWGIAKMHNLKPENVISFASKVTPILAVLRKNLLDGKQTQIVYTDTLPASFDAETIKKVYGYTFELKKIENITAIPEFDGSTILVSARESIANYPLHSNIDFLINTHGNLGSVLLVNGTHNESYISAIQHVRRRETVAMTPINCLTALKSLATTASFIIEKNNVEADKAQVVDLIKTINGVQTKALVGSSGLSIQYAIMMGLVHDALENHPGKDIKFIVPPNCYGGTNDQARRVAACIENVAIVDLPVDGDNDMVKSVHNVLQNVAQEDAIPYIIAEIPTNPRVEVPELEKLKEALEQERKTATGETAIAPVFILDQTFCPNVHFLGEGKTFAGIRAISYASGSKFPSGGLCTAGYCIGNEKATSLVEKIEVHLTLCDNEATIAQYEILAQQLPSMNQRIHDAYVNTREFVNYIQEVLPEAKINFVSSALASQGFTPSVFSLDLPTKGDTEEEKEAYKRKLNHKLIKLMITEIPEESKYCVSYGQLKGCYWTIPATSTQGTTKEGDKDYIARVSLSANMDLEKHKAVFNDFVKSI
ncbi:PLP-dependent aminotransferase family protein [Kordia jejudonensis]|uniref:cystathionine beta-synthase n=1 Tax=Kordia jejudonensis TaxID=1348245 RepID=UPI000629AA1F|nr:cystathionine beta-synthase [Kordia jejudonensis]